MVRAGLGSAWSCLFANDIDPKKASSYTRNWGAGELRIADVATLTTRDIPGIADLAWASFPCQDLSLAGSGAGLQGERSGTFWPFWNLLEALAREGRAPRAVALENVCGALTSHRGRDFLTISKAITSAGYRFGALVIDAVRFVPQSRPRLFIIAIHSNCLLPDRLISDGPNETWFTSTLIQAQQSLPKNERDNWIWWRLPSPGKRNSGLADIVEDDPEGVSWHSRMETRRLLDMMSPVNAAKVAKAMKSGVRTIGTIYKRTRVDEKGIRKQRAEIRFDDVAGCLRTPVGGSSRQTIMIVEGRKIRSRLLSPREAARLMGLPEKYELPQNYNEAYFLSGDGVVVPVVKHIAENILTPALSAFEHADEKVA